MEKKLDPQASPSAGGGNPSGKTPQGPADGPGEPGEARAQMLADMGREYSKFLGAQREAFQLTQRAGEAFARAMMQIAADALQKAEARSAPEPKAKGAYHKYWCAVLLYNAACDCKGPTPPPPPADPLARSTP